MVGAAFVLFGIYLTTKLENDNVVWKAEKNQ